MWLHCLKVIWFQVLVVRELCFPLEWLADFTPSRTSEQLLTNHIPCLKPYTYLEEILSRKICWCIFLSFFPVRSFLLPPPTFFFPRLSLNLKSKICLNWLQRAWGGFVSTVMRVLIGPEAQAANRPLVSVSEPFACSLVRWTHLLMGVTSPRLPAWNRGRWGELNRNMGEEWKDCKMQDEFCRCTRWECQKALKCQLAFVCAFFLIFCCCSKSAVSVSAHWKSGDCRWLDSGISQVRMSLKLCGSDVLSCSGPLCVCAFIKRKWSLD